VVGADGSSRFSGLPGKSFAEWARDITAIAPSVNVASMIGLGSVRAAVIGDDDRRGTAAQLTRMTAMVERALAEGACGASTGLEYTPGRVRLARRAHGALSPAVVATSAVRHAHAQRRRPAPGSDRRVHCGGAWRRMSVAGVAPQAAGHAQLAQAGCLARLV
jgi:hypothetical protein